MKDRLKTYSALAAPFAIAVSANAQIVYENIEPDVTLSGTSATHALDIDSDGITDFIIGQENYSYTYTGYTTQYFVKGNFIMQGDNTIGSVACINKQIVFSSYSATTYPFGVLLQEGDLIDENLSFNQASDYKILAMSAVYSFTYKGGEFIGSTGFLPIRFQGKKGLHYGWVRLSVADDASSITILDYAYHKKHDKPIKAGEQ